MQVTLFIYKVQSAFAEATENRYIVQVHQFGTPRSKWSSAGSLVELHYKLQPSMPAFDWEEIERKLESNGGFEMALDIEEFAYHKLFV